MKIRSIRILLAAVAALASVTAGEAQTKPSLVRFAGSYTGTATSNTAAGTLGSNATLTFTGFQGSLRGTFLYTGILNQLGVAQNVNQTLNITRKGRLRGRVNVGSINGTGSGSARLTGKQLRVSMTYLLQSLPSPTAITFTGAVKFAGKRAIWTTTVTSSDPTFNGSLVVQGRR
ncbi:MAG: hypothetical protein PHC88_07175 [Terrimicrobiaceae bacterium]|nr:hypothetical protein [Terrimicrobiaceae bacterium]